jgi:spore coat polysaccharide biosynthesis protein SpsF
LITQDVRKSAKKKRRVVAIIQARMGSKRLPGKSMADLAGKPLLWHVLQRVKRSKKIDTIVLATTAKKEDDVLIGVARECGVSVFRGSENDLVDRYYQAAKKYKADIVVRIGADNPCLEPSEIDRIIEFHKRGGSDFSTNTQSIDENGYPDGLGAEVFDFGILEKLWKITKEPRHREHVHSYFYENSDKFILKTIPCPAEFSRPDLKLDVNTDEELAFLRALYEYLYPRKKDFHITDIIKWYDNIYRAADSLSK